MANRYWRGGTGTWDTTTTTNWSTSSGGAGGASVPTASDSVFFDQAGTYTVTMTGALTCLNITVSAGTVTFADGTTPTLAVSGSMSVIAGTVWTSTAVITFNATTTGKTISTNGVAIAGNIILDGVGGGWTLGSNFATSGGATFTVTNGSFSTSASNYSLTVLSFNSTNSNTRTVSFNGSTVSISSTLDFTTSTNLTFNAGTSQINMTASGMTFNGGGQTFYNVSSTNTAGGQSLPITGANTFNNLSFASMTNKRVSTLVLSANQTINGTLTNPAGTTAGSSRLFIYSSTIGTAYTITAAAVSLVDVDFRDITGAGAASPFTGTRLGNAGGNSGITFGAGVNKYFVGTTSASWSASQWATSSGGSVAAANFPLAQDTCNIDNSSLNAAATLTLDANYNIGSVTFVNRTNTIVFATGSTLPIIYGNVTYAAPAVITSITGTGTWTYSGRSTQVITSSGLSIPQPLTINTASSTVQLADNVTTTAATTLTQGTLDLNSKTLTTLTWSSNNSNTRSILFGTGKVSITGSGTMFQMTSATNFTYTGTPTVEINNNTATTGSISSGGLTESNAVNFNIISGTYPLTLLNARNVNFTGFTGTLNNGSRIIYGNITFVSGMSITAGPGTTTFGATSGTQQITTATQTLDFPLTINGSGGTVQLQDALTMGSSRLFTHTNGTVNLNGKTLTVGSNYTTAAGTKNLTFNGGTLVCPASSTTAFNNAAPTNYTTTAGAGGNGTISLTGATAKTFVGGGSTYAATLNQGGAGTLTISGSNTLAGISNSYSATGATTISFTSSTTQTVSSFTATGTVGKVLTLNAVTSGTFASMVLSSGTVSGIDYLSIQDSHVTPATTTWYAGANSTNVSGNTGWIFTAAPATNTGSFFIFLGS